jgi:hypothetical protein
MCLKTAIQSEYLLSLNHIFLLTLTLSCRISYVFHLCAKRTHPIFINFLFELLMKSANYEHCSTIYSNHRIPFSLLYQNKVTEGIIKIFKYSNRWCAKSEIDI